MSNFDKAIEIIMAEPPEMHYPTYFADLLRKADVPDKDAGKCSEIPNSSDLISKQAAISLAGDLQIHGDEYRMYNQAINNYCAEIMRLPSAQPERPTGEWIYQTKFGRIECNKCGHVFRTYIHPRNFCPNCGADMRGEQDEND